MDPRISALHMDKTPQHLARVCGPDGTGRILALALDEKQQEPTGHRTQPRAKSVQSHGRLAGLGSLPVDTPLFTQRLPRIWPCPASEFGLGKECAGCAGLGQEKFPHLPRRPRPWSFIHLTNVSRAPAGPSDEDTALPGLWCSRGPRRLTRRSRDTRSPARPEATNRRGYRSSRPARLPGGGGVGTTSDRLLCPLRPGSGLYVSARYGLA